MKPIVHAITPGDHFSPRTGSAIPTVIHGLASAATRLGDVTPQSVLVAAGTYPDRYSSMPAMEYRQRAEPGRPLQAADLAAGRLTGVRPFQRRSLAALVGDQHVWPSSLVLAHNLIQLSSVVDHRLHRPVLYAHNDLFRTYRPRESARALAHTALVVCVSEFLADRIGQQLPAGLRDRVVAVPNAADCEQFPAPRRTPEPHRLRVAFAGRVVPDKGPDVLLTAARRLGDPRIEITIIGSAGFDGAAQLTRYERDLRRLASGAGSPVRFLPFTDRAALPALLQSHDVLVVPSRWPEPWGLTVSEGQACGLVVLASDVGGIPEAISDPGHLVPAGDPDALAAQLKRFVDDPELLARHQAHARDHAETHDWRHAWNVLSRHLDKVA